MNQTTIAGRLDEIVRLLSEIRDGLSTSCPQPCSQLRGCVAQTKEEKEPSPRTPYREKEETGENNRNARTREKFVKPTLEEVAAYMREKGYSVDAEEFWNFYESKGWKVGRDPMKSWQAACVTWQKKERVFGLRRSSSRSAAPRRSDNWLPATDAQRKEFCDGIEG